MEEQERDSGGDGEGSSSPYTMASFTPSFLLSNWLSLMLVWLFQHLRESWSAAEKKLTYFID